MSPFLCPTHNSSTCISLMFHSNSMPYFCFVHLVQFGSDAEILQVFPEAKKCFTLELCPQVCGFVCLFFPSLSISVSFLETQWVSFCLSHPLWLTDITLTFDTESDCIMCDLSPDAKLHNYKGKDPWNGVWHKLTQQKKVSSINATPSKTQTILIFFFWFAFWPFVLIQNAKVQIPSDDAAAGRSPRQRMRMRWKPARSPDAAGVDAAAPFLRRPRAGWLTLMRTDRVSQPSAATPLSPQPLLSHPVTLSGRCGAGTSLRHHGSNTWGATTVSPRSFAVESSRVTDLY